MSEKPSMINPSIDTLLTKVENKYMLTTLVAKRAREIFMGEEPLTDEKFVNNVTTSVHEVFEDKVSYELKDEQNEQ